MARRYSIVTKRFEDIPESPKSETPPDHAQTIADLRVQLAQEQGRREAAEARCTDLEVRLLAGDERAAALTEDLDRARNRIEALIAAPPVLASSVLAPEPATPVVYEAVVTRRDAEGKLERMTVAPMKEL